MALDPLNSSSLEQLALNGLRHTTVDIARPQRMTATQEHLEKGYGEGNEDGGLQV